MDSGEVYYNFEHSFLKKQAKNLVKIKLLIMLSVRFLSVHENSKSLIER